MAYRRATGRRRARPTAPAKPKAPGKATPNAKAVANANANASFKRVAASSTVTPKPLVRPVRPAGVREGGGFTGTPTPIATRPAGAADGSTTGIRGTGGATGGGTFPTSTTTDLSRAISTKLRLGR